MKRPDPQFAICVKNKNYRASLELGKLYGVVADETDAQLSQIRVIDESGEAYLYPKDYFTLVQPRPPVA